MKCTTPLLASAIALGKSWCPTCDWLLRHERHCPPKHRPTNEELLAVGHPVPGYHARQEWEPIPFAPLPVEHWPEVT